MTVSESDCDVSATCVVDAKGVVIAVVVAGCGTEDGRESGDDEERDDNDIEVDVGGRVDREDDERERLSTIVWR